LNAPTYQTVPVACPRCRHNFVAPVLSIIDAGRSPEAKRLFLSGQINIAACPQCGNAGMLSTPLVYHDPEKELLFTFIPPDAGASETEHERIIGELTNRVISGLPAEERKGYLLRPRSFLRLEGMIEAILEADGITPEMLEAQRAKADLLDRLLRTVNEDSRRAIARENDGLIDYAFFELLSLNIELAQSDPETQIAQDLTLLREQLLQWTTQGQDVAAREDAVRSLGTEITREGLLEKLVEAALSGEQVKIESMVAVARPAIDYIFYQQLTGRIEAEEGAGSAETAETLRVLRETILDLTAQIDDEIQKATEQASQFLQHVLQSEDPDAEIRANVHRLDGLFLSVLDANIQSAERSGQTELLDRLQQIFGAVMTQVLESQPPQIRLISELLGAEFPDGTRELLEVNREQIDGDLLDVMASVEKDLSSRGQTDVVGRLSQIREQAVELERQSLQPQ
jgi:hypothetical protein